MGKPKYDPPAPNFPYKIRKRLNKLSVPKGYIQQEEEDKMTAYGVKKSALSKAPVSDRVVDAAWPYLRRLIALKKTYKARFPPDRLEIVDRAIEASNATHYSKLAKCTIDLKNKDNTKDVKKKKGWSESDWKKHMDYIGQIAAPKKTFDPPPVERGDRRPLAELAPRAEVLSQMPHFKTYRRLSKETWYRDPEKVPPNALKYEISDRVKKLATPKPPPMQ